MSKTFYKMLNYERNTDAQAVWTITGYNIWFFSSRENNEIICKSNELKSGTFLSKIRDHYHQMIRPHFDGGIKL